MSDIIWAKHRLVQRFLFSEIPGYKQKNNIAHILQYGSLNFFSRNKEMSDDVTWVWCNGESGQACIYLWGLWWPTSCLSSSLTEYGWHDCMNTSTDRHVC